MNLSAAEVPQFPNTPHLRGSCGTSDDTFMDWDMTYRILSRHVLVQEKLDGVNLGFYVESESKLAPILKDRRAIPSSILNSARIAAFLSKYSDDIKDVLGLKYAIFGEYVVWAKALIPWFAFDIFDREEGRFVSQKMVDSLLTDLPVPRVPVLYTGILGSLLKVESLISHSCISGQRMEGLYLRIDDEGFLRERYKYVRSDYAKTSHDIA